jgi:ribokinase
MYDVITIGSAVKEIFIIAKGSKLIKSKKFKTGLGECFTHGSKVEIHDIQFSTGGGATNTATTFSNLGLKTSIVSRIGNDIYGAELLHTLAASKINTSNLIMDKLHKTGYSTTLVSAGGDRTILVYRGASDNFSAKEFTWSRLKTKWFYISSLGGNSSLLKEIFAFAKKNNIKIAWNPGSKELKLGKEKLKPLIKQVNIFNINSEEAQKITGKKDIKKMMAVLAKMTKAFVIITDGAKGAYLSDGILIYKANTLGSKAVNTTGAGDAFGSGFCTGIILKNDWDYAMRLAVLNSDGVIQVSGAKNGLLDKLPTKKDLNKVKINIYGKI